ncbi:MAG: ABC transporter ATP-binding protein [Syntrophomonadaceae bacterium]|nr:ABC transporter ATP-binding protein [Syntrophomonadaceae bacterium]
MPRKVLMTLNRISKTYDMGEIKVKALQETNLEIYSGELLIILGPSGSGKSTLLNIIGGMEQPTTGEIIFDNQDLSNVDEHLLTSFRRHEVGFVFQFYNLISDLTAYENVQLAGDLVQNPFPVPELLEAVGLKDRMHHFPSQLSGGEQQRVSIARALVKRPRLLLCDEPTGALDYQTGKTILGLLKKVNQDYGTTVLIITHNTAIGYMGDRVVRMRSGEVVETMHNDQPLAPERIEW